MLEKATYEDIDNMIIFYEMFMWEYPAPLKDAFIKAKIKLTTENVEEVCKQLKIADPFGKLA